MNRDVFETVLVISLMIFYTLMSAVLALAWALWGKNC